jgi:hypothetical protein
LFFVFKTPALQTAGFFVFSKSLSALASLREPPIRLGEHILLDFNLQSSIFRQPPAGGCILLDQLNTQNPTLKTSATAPGGGGSGG